MFVAEEKPIKEIADHYGLKRQRVEAIIRHLLAGMEKLNPEQYILYYIGKSNDTAFEADPAIYDTDKYFDRNLLQAVRLLAEIGNGKSMDVLLEGLRLDEAFYGYHYGDALMEGYVPAFAKLGAGYLDKLMSYAKEPGLYDMAHHVVIEAAGVIYAEHEELREDLIGWFRELITFFKESMDAGDDTHCSHTLMGYLMVTLMGIESGPLLPLVKEIFEKGYVNQEV